MNKNIRPISEEERNINWEEVEYKISIICRKFNNIDRRFIDDLAQELRIHAFYYSDDYYDLHRKAIDFWRSLQVHIMPEIPYFDFDILSSSFPTAEQDLVFEDMVKSIRGGIEDKNHRVKEHIRELALEIFEYILDGLLEREPQIKVRDSDRYQPYYRGSRINCSYVWDAFGEYSGDRDYKDIRKAVKYLEATILELAEKGEIEIPRKYFG